MEKERSWCSSCEEGKSKENRQQAWTQVKEKPSSNRHTYTHILDIGIMKDGLAKTSRRTYWVAKDGQKPR